MVTLEKAGVTYGLERAFSGVSLSLGRGEQVSIIGPSGCGKTSLLYAIAGLLPLSTGKLQLSIPVSGCGIMFQDDRLLPWKSLLQNVLLGMGSDPSTVSAAEALLERFRLASHMHKYPGALSGGQRQRGALARVLVRKPALLLLDEPLASLDAQTREDLQEEIKAYAASHSITVLIVTHSIEEAVFMGQRIFVMSSWGLHGETLNPWYECGRLREEEGFFSIVSALRRTLSSIMGDSR